MGLAGILPFAGPAVDGIFNLGSTIFGNQVARERAGEANALIDTFNTDIDAERDLWGQSDIFGGMLDQNRFGGDQFRTTTDFGQMLQGMQNDLGQTQGRVDDLFNRSYTDPRSVARQAGSYISDIGTDAYERDAINDISSASRGRFAQGQSDLIGRALGQGRGLGDTRDAMAALRYGEGVNRSNAIDSVMANAEGMRNQNMQMRGQLQNSALMGQIGTNAQLVGAHAGLTSELGSQGASARYNVGALKTATEDQDQTQGFDAYMNMLNAAQTQNSDAWNKAQTLLGMKQQNILTQAGITAGTPFTIPQMTLGRDMAQNLLQQQAIGASRQSQKASVSFLGIGGGCIDANTEVLTPRGPVVLAGIVPGDSVMGEDRKYHEVLAKDCGTVPEEGQKTMVRICTKTACIDATPDHVIGGKPAGQWRPGDRIATDDGHETVQSIVESAYRVSGDLILEDNIPYLAGGFVVHSNIGRNGLAAWRESVSESGCELDGYMVSPDNPNGVWAKMEPQEA